MHRGLARWPSFKISDLRLHRLPVDMLGVLISHVPSAELMQLRLVSKSFDEVVRSALIEITFKPSVTSSQIYSFLSRCINVQHISCHNLDPSFLGGENSSTARDETSFSALSSLSISGSVELHGFTLPDVRKLTFTGCLSTPSDFEWLVGFPGLEEVVVNAGSSVSAAVICNVLSSSTPRLSSLVIHKNSSHLLPYSLVHCCGRLSHLEIYSVAGVTLTADTAFIDGITENCVSMETVRFITAESVISTTSPLPIGAGSLMRLFKRCSNMRVLRVGPLLLDSWTNLTRKMTDLQIDHCFDNFSRFIASCPLLERIAAPLGDIVLRTAGMLTHLRVLHLQVPHDTLLVPSDIQVLATSCTVLKSVRLQGGSVSANDVSTLLHYSRSIESLFVNKVVIDYRYVPMACQSPLLRLNIGIEEHDEPTLSSMFCGSVMRYVPNLCRLSVRSSRHDGWMVAAAHYCKMLSSVHSSAVDVSDSMVARLGRACPGLTDVRFPNSRLLTSMSLQTLAVCCSRLSAVHLHFDKLGADMFQQFVYSCSKLAVLRLLSRQLCTGDLLALIPHAVPNLTELDVSSFDASPSSIRTTIESLPKLIRVQVSPSLCLSPAQIVAC